MKLCIAPYIFTPQGYKENYAIVFEEKIIDIAPSDTMLKAYPHASIVQLPPNSVAYPGFVNSHVHLEFSSNDTTLRYGAFVPWLESIIAHREELANKPEAIKEACNQMLLSGITAFGAVSSYGFDLEACYNTPQRVVYFNECIGSNPQMLDALFEDFLGRIEASEKAKSSTLTPAIAIHSPYAVHPNMIAKSLALAKERNYLVSAHFLESPAEKEWLTNDSGDFKQFFETFLNTSKAVTTTADYLAHFDSIPTHFIHCCEATNEELDKLQQAGHSIAHCPRSNKLLGCKRLQIENIKSPWCIATDGKSSNWSLNIFDELRAALMLHPIDDIHGFAYKLILNTTQTPADILKLPCGTLEVGKSADLSIITLPDTPQTVDEIALWTILYTQKATQVYIQGERHV